MQQQSVIVLVILGRGGLIVGDLHIIELFGMVEELRWLGDLNDIIFLDLMYLLEL